MKALVFHRYGSPDVLQYEDVEKPVPGPDEMLLRVRAASVNPLDWHFMRGTPLVARAAFGLRGPNTPRLGTDVAGEVEAVGANVTRFRPGDAVFGACRGAFAEYVCVSQAKVAAKPVNATFEQAAAVPVAGLTALQGLRDKGRIQPNHTVLINGAAGGVGTFAVQIARLFDAHVTGVCSTRNVEMVRSLGADRVIDYTREDFTQGTERYDVLLDCVGHGSLSACRGVMTPRGIYVGIGGAGGEWVGPLPRLLTALVLSPFVSQRLVTMFASLNNDDLAVLKEMIEAGKVSPVIDRCYLFNEAPQAIRHVDEGHARGKVVITMAGGTAT